MHIAHASRTISTFLVCLCKMKCETYLVFCELQIIVSSVLAEGSADLHIKVKIQR